MKIFLISQDKNNDYDTYDSAVVIAKDKDEASKMHPGQENAIWNSEEQKWFYRGHNGGLYPVDEQFTPWVKHPDDVKVDLIGTADKDEFKRRFVLKSFNAG